MRRSLLPTLGVVLLTTIAVSRPPAASGQALAAPAKAVTTPKQFFGFNMGDDYCLANYQQLKGYWEKLEKESDRIKLVTIGTTEEGRPQLAAIVTSPANHKKLDRYRETARHLALADGVSAAEARQLAAAGKAVVWIDAGLHASETLCAQALIETVYQILAGNDEETLRILDDVVILFVHCNPDGHDLVADWYMREKEPTKRSLGGLPRLYQKYIGHDNNRDFYANTQAETKNLNRFMYREWFPQIMYNHHQTGPAGTVLFCPPFRDPFNYFCDPLVLNGIDSVGAAMMQRFLTEGKPGATSRSGAPYSTWFNGGLRTTAGFHNMIGILTETIGGPTPTRIPLVPAKQLPKGDYLAPIEPQVWKFRQSVDYSVTANRAVLDYASRHREQLLYNIWLMGHNAIERGNRDSWTVTPKVVEAAQGGRPPAPVGGQGGRGGGAGGGGAANYAKLFRDPAKRDARGYILPADQPDFLTATKFINALLGTGIRVHRATAAFEVAGKSYPKGSYIVQTAQAFRAHVLDMFEPQDHPNDFAYPGGPPIRPYDSAGYTPAFQMALKFDRILDGFSGPFEEIKGSVVPPPPAGVRDAADAVGFFLSPRMNDSFRAVNRLQKAGEEVRRLQEPVVVAGVKHPAGTFYVSRKPTTLAALEKIAAEIGTPFQGSKIAPGPEAVVLKSARIALWDRYGGSMPSGWTRWLLEQFEFPFKLVYAPELDKGDLRDKFDVLILVDGAYGTGGGRGGLGGAGGFGDRPDDGGGAANRPGDDPYRDQRGNLTQKTTLPQLKKFLEAGGTILAIGSSTRLGAELGLPVANYLAEAAEGDGEQPLSSNKFYVPTSVLRTRVDPTTPLTWGLDDQVDVVFSSSPTFRLTSGAEAKGVRRVAWYDTNTPLRSGWAWGQSHLEGGTAIVDARVGKGRLALFGPQVLFRGQPHGTFKFVFNGIVQSVVTEKRTEQSRLTPPSVEGIKGVLILTGPRPVSGAVVEQFVAEAGGEKGKVVLLSHTSPDDGAALRELKDRLAKAKVSVQLLSGSVLHNGDRDGASKVLDEATGVWLDSAPIGQDSGANSALEAALKRMLGRGGVLAGEGAIAAANSFGLLPGVRVAAVGSKNDELDQLRWLVSQVPGTFGIGVEERSAVLIKGRRIVGLGDGPVYLLHSAGAGRAASETVLKSRDAADLVSQQRVALQRTQAPFPQAKPDSPKVPAGSLLIGGGGESGDEIWKKFIDLAGGPDAAIVVIPTAMDDPVAAEPGEARTLTRCGAKNVTVLHTRKREEADTEAFVNPLRQAKGVWFAGDQPWRLVDAYEGTATEKTFRDVLARGGAIGGSSAGASIQSEYMPRGNGTVVAEGYERGFGFLKGVAVDPHYSVSKGQVDMTRLMADYPQLLGIGIDEGTAIIVRGGRMEVVGRSKVAMYDRRKPLSPGQPDYEELPSGAVYDLVDRKRVTTK